jgi:hypothetical protein
VTGRRLFEPVPVAFDLLDLFDLERGVKEIRVAQGNEKRRPPHRLCLDAARAAHLA